MHAALQDYSDPNFGYGYYGSYYGKGNRRQQQMQNIPTGRFGFQPGKQQGKRINHREDARKLLASNLPRSTNREQLQEYFGKFGEVEDAFIVKDTKTGKSRGFGFVKFADEDSVEKAMAKRPHKMTGTGEGEAGEPREIIVKRVLNVDRQENLFTSKVVFVGGIRDNNSEEQIKEYFSKFGNVESVEVAKDKDGKRRRFAMVTFDDYDAVDKVMGTRGHKIGENTVGCKKFLTKEELAKIDSQRQDRQFGDHILQQAEWARMYSRMAMSEQGPLMGGPAPLMQRGGGGGMAGVGSLGMGGYGDYGHLKQKAGMKQRSGAANLSPAERKFLQLLEEASVSRECINILMGENLVNPDVLSALSSMEFSQIPITMGDRTRLQLVLTSLGYGGR